MSRMWAKPLEAAAKVATTVHERGAITTDCVRHADTDFVPCWCGATDRDADGLNVLSSEDWTPGGISRLLESIAAYLKAPKPVPVALKPVDLSTLSESALMAAWTAADANARPALDAEMARRDDWSDTTSTGSSVAPSIDADYAAYLHAQYLEACDATHSYMVSAAGLARGYAGTDFFKVGRRPSVEKWGTDELRAWFGSVNAAQSDTRGAGHVLSKTEYAAALTSERDLVAA